ncbi:NTP transferase domain-containing protein [Rhodobacterales bacterium HKCCE2091]|nr:NTP transferase domain-containing protein [Rhodobacterales bacterium HKCCE2091]
MDVRGAGAGAPPAVILLAGGRGSRLHELTETTCKPAVPFAGGCRIVDFVVANIAGSGFAHATVATQYMADPLERHLAARWRRDRTGLSLHMRRPGGAGYRGTADAVHRNLDPDTEAGEVIVLSADHVYGMDYRPMLAAHRASGAMVTLAADVVPRTAAHAFGVIDADSDGRVLSFLEKPRVPPAMPGHPDRALVSMGIYVFDRAWLSARLADDARDLTSGHDFGHDILPRAVAEGVVHVHGNGAEGAAPYWRDVGSLDALRLTWLDFVRADPPCALPDPVATCGIGPRASWPGLSRSVLAECGTVAMPGATVARGARVSRAILGPGAEVPASLVIGEDPDEDALWFRRTETGTTLVTAAMLARRRDERQRLFQVPANIVAIRKV